MKLGIIIAVAILFIAISIYIVNAFCYYNDKEGYQTISYDEFIKLMAVAPEKWEISDWASRVYYNNTIIYMKTYFDELRLAHAKKKSDKLILQSAMDKKRAELIKSWQSDIDNYRSEYMDVVKTYLDGDKIL